MPPRMMRYNSGMHNNMNTAAAAAAAAAAASAATPNIVSAEPQLINRDEPQHTGSTIEAKPKMRYILNLYAFLIFYNNYSYELY